MRSLRDQLSDKQQRIRQLEDELSRRPTKEVLKEVVKEVPVYKSTISSTSTEEEKNHVIKVLEHESKVYSLEKSILGVINPGASFRPKSNLPQQNIPTDRFDDFVTD